MNYILFKSLRAFQLIVPCMSCLFSLKNIKKCWFLWISNNAGEGAIFRRRERRLVALRGTGDLANLCTMLRNVETFSFLVPCAIVHVKSWLVRRIKMLF